MVSRTTLRRPADRDGFRQLVYRIVRSIPPGRVMTYGDIGRLIPPPAGTDTHGYARIRARWVGYALAACPEDLPWHRVVNASGAISPRFGIGPALQHELLRQEGIELNPAQRVDLVAHRWRPPAGWLSRQGLLA